MNNASTSQLILGTAMLLVAIVLMLFLLASFTVIPMYENYKQCGTIFLCSARAAHNEVR